jgi:y4mF family transcriptional regulator
LREQGLLKYTTADIGKLIRATRKKLGVTQKALALTSGTGLRFIIELEKGKETCEIGKALTVLNTLGIKMTLTPPAAAAKQGSADDPHA